MDMETSVDDWSGHALENGVDPLGVAFIRLRPELLNNYDPNNRSNGTQRSWFKLLTEVPSDLPTDLYLMVAEGKVGEGNAAEWVAARDMMHKMPSVDVIRMQPDDAEVPTEAAVKYAVAASMAMTTTLKLWPRDIRYIKRMPKEFQMLYITDALNLNPEITSTKEWIDWACENSTTFTTV